MRMNSHKYRSTSLRRVYNKALQFYSNIPDVKNQYALICAAPINCDIYEEWDGIKYTRTCAICDNCPYEVHFDWEEF